MKRHSTAVVRCCCQDNNLVYNKLLEACNGMGFSVLKASKHEFFPHGLTAFVILAESHAAIHTYPEDGVIYIDVFSCSEDKPPEGIINCFSKLLNGELGKSNTQKRD